MPNSISKSVVIIDLLKALGSQLIVWHHLAFYGPMSDVVYPSARWLIDFLYKFARLPVHMFIVISGFLVARSVMSKLDGSFPIQHAVTAILIRYWRLAKLYWCVLVLVIVAAWVARTLIVYPETPAAPTLSQFLAHLFLFQDILQYDSLSAGFWYVAIDFQLYASFIILVWGIGRLRLQSGQIRIWVLTGVNFVLIVWAWLGIAFDDAYDAWAIYFYGSYSLGVLSYLLQRQRQVRYVYGLLGFLIIVLTIKWHNSIALAGLTSLALIVYWSWKPNWYPRVLRLLHFFARISYSVFLIHYAVFLVIGSVVTYYWPTHLVMNWLGMITTWLCSILAGAVLHYWLELRTLGRSH